MTKHISQLAVFHSELPWSNPQKKSSNKQIQVKEGYWEDHRRTGKWLITMDHDDHKSP